MKQIVRLKPVKFIVAFIGVVGLYMGFIYAADFTFYSETYYGCAVCRASKSCSKLYGVILPVNYKSNEFSRYYIRNVDTKHKHKWLFCGVSRETRSGGMSAHGTAIPFMLPHKPALAILKSLPDTRTRKAFFEQLCVPEEGNDPATKNARTKIIKGIWQLREAYRDDEGRADWCQQVKKAGLYPK